ncbi:hypothetical protein CLV56_3130 [Mumia flava]|uniref:Uncharacterized protein n=1 Tax=Mumia flava TaxID=1348852 RepID=A0A2M9B6S5_9ACTN|nr:esterase-like activity of phytase family protein [Mumia flava]PJJ53639.1 hypothetical protein CLV56_3130 [Mumia flava]
MSRTSRRTAAGLAAAAVAAALVPSMLSGPADAHGKPSHGKPSHGKPSHGKPSHGKPSHGKPHATAVFDRTATYPVFQNLPADVDPDSETVAEISSVSPDGRTLVYTDAPGKRIGFVDLADPDAPEGLGTLSLAELGDADDEPTSVAVVGDYVLVVVNTSESFTNPSGRVDVVRLSDRTRVRSLDLGGQPDSIAISSEGDRAVIAIENERDEEATPAGGEEGDLPQLPAGFLQVLDLDGAPAAWEAHRVELTEPDGTARADFVAAGVVEPTDPEPEYVAINGRDEAAVTLQENNAVAIVDLESREITSVFSAGSVTLDGVDATEDDDIALTDTLTDVVREPDAVAWVDDDHLATANEGDWHGGSRGWTVFAADGRVVWDAGTSFERIVTRLGLHNEDRAGNKGAEPEGIAVATFGRTRYAFVGSERSNVVAVYDVDDPAKPRYVQSLPTTNGPEGLLPIPGRDLLAVSSEEDSAADGVRATVSLYELGRRTPSFPSIESADDRGNPIGWNALGALSADPRSKSRLWTAADNVVQPARLYAVDTRRTPALITRTLPITEAGAPVELDIEGVAAREQGGFWLASEGETGPENELIRTNAAGEVRERVTLPAEIAAHVGKWGLEGVTLTNDRSGEHVWTVVQRPLWTDPASTGSTVDGADVARIGRYDVAGGTWQWYGYTMASTDASGDWVGLSEITALDDDTLAVIERDKLNGPSARLKRVVVVDVPSRPARAGLTMVRPRRTVDLLPELEATHGWTQEKLEGFTVGGDGRAYAVTDNDGVQDATGETVFLRLGNARVLLGGGHPGRGYGHR